MSLKDHLSESLKLTPAPSPWPRMVLCCLSVTLPLIAGLALNEQAPSIYGALLGLTLILNDHFGPYLKRVQHLFASFFFLALAFMTGLYISGHLWLLFPLLFLMAFALGKSKGIGLELERILLFSTFQLLNGALTPELKEHASKLFLYAGLSFVNYLICLSLVFVLLKHQAALQRSKREELKEAIKKKDTIRYAFTLASVSCIGLLIAEYFHLSKGNWMVGTILIVMMPSKAQSYHRSFQRIFGTFIGVIIASVITTFAHDPIVLVSFSAIAAFLAPLGLIRNYWLGSVMIAALIMFFMQFATMNIHPVGYDFALLRVLDISLGCLIGALGTLIAFPHSFFKK